MCFTSSLMVQFIVTWGTISLLSCVTEQWWGFIDGIISQPTMVQMDISVFKSKSPARSVSVEMCFETESNSSRRRNRHTCGNIRATTNPHLVLKIHFTGATIGCWQRDLQRELLLRDSGDFNDRWSWEWNAILLVFDWPIDSWSWTGKEKLKEAMVEHKLHNRQNDFLILKYRKSL